MAFWTKGRSQGLPSWSKKPETGKGRGLRGVKPRLRIPPINASADGPGLLFVLVALVVVAVAGARLFGFAPELAQRTGEVLVFEGESSPNSTVPVAAPERTDAGRIVIYHAHATENYQPNPPHTRNGRPGDIVQVGAELAAALEGHGFAVEHIVDVFDYPQWSEAFPRSGEAVARVLERHSDVIAIIDVHRDAIAAGAPRSALTTVAGGEEAARILLVVGEADNPYATRNAAFAEAIKARMEASVPQLLRGVRLHTSNYNGHLHPNSVQVFIGDYERNTVAQARAGARALAGVLADVLKDRQAGK